MGEPDEVSCIHPHEREAADPTPGKRREQAIATGGLWSGLVRTERGVTSGWHHHGEHHTSTYGTTPSVAIVSRSGTGPPTVNVDGPAASSQQ